MTGRGGRRGGGGRKGGGGGGRQSEAEGERGADKSNRPFAAEPQGSEQTRRGNSNRYAVD